MGPIQIEVYRGVEGKQRLEHNGRIWGEWVWDRKNHMPGRRTALWDQVLLLSSLHHFYARVALKESFIS